MERKQHSNSMLDVASSRQAQEVQAAMVIAQKFPRDTNRAFTRVIEDCKRKALAEKAIYSYKRGTSTVSGPSIRIAEAIAKAFGNLDYGVIELDKKPGLGSLPGESTVMSYCWDLETNTRSSKVFTISHRRDTKSGGYNLTDERDIYEITANNGARRLRACILNIVPSDFVDAALEQCRQTLKNNTEPLVDRVRKMVVFAKDNGVTQVMLEKFLGHGLDSITEDELIDIRGIFNAIKDGTADRSDYFELSPSEDQKDVTPPKAEAKDSVTASDTRSAKSLKNHAPKSKEEAEKSAKDLNARADAEALEKATQTPTSKQSEPASAAPKKARGDLIMELVSYQSALEMTVDEFNSEILRLTKKSKKQDLTSAEMQDLIDIFEIRLIKKAEQENQLDV